MIPTLPRALVSSYHGYSVRRRSSRTLQSPSRRKRTIWLYLTACRYFVTTSGVTGLNVAVLTGSTRTSGPPQVLGPRVEQFIVDSLKERDGLSVTTVINPRDFSLLEKPAFAYTKSHLPDHLKEIGEKLAQADAYVCITPEYNHAPSPGLVNILNHFGSSTFSYKPSAIVSYSAGQWGGTRAAIALRPILSELGCLPVSAIIHIPKVADVLDENGAIIGGDGKSQEWQGYVNRSFSQLEWWGEAAHIHRQAKNPFKASPAFRSDPSQRNAP